MRLAASGSFDDSRNHWAYSGNSLHPNPPRSSDELLAPRGQSAGRFLPSSQPETHGMLTERSTIDGRNAVYAEESTSTVRPRLSRHMPATAFEISTGP